MTINAPYTPTTEQVRSRYAEHCYEGEQIVDKQITAAQFDRWVTAHDAERDTEIARLRRSVDAVRTNADYAVEFYRVGDSARTQAQDTLDIIESFNSQERTS